MEKKGEKIVATLGRDNTQQKRNHGGIDRSTSLQQILGNKMDKQPAPVKKNRLISPEERKAELIQQTKNEAFSNYTSEVTTPAQTVVSTPQTVYSIKKEKKTLSSEVKHFLNKYKRKLWLGLGLTAAGMIPAMSASGENPSISKKAFNDSTQTSDAKKIEGEIKKTSEKIEIKIANYFQTDKAEISKENDGEISKLVSTYITNLNKDNIDQFINSTPTLNVSCDPRKTNSYEDGNRGLAQARAEETQKVIRNMISGFNFSKSGLTPQQIKKIIEKFSNLKFNIPENGVIDYHAIATETEWTETQTNETKKLEIYQRMRFVNLELATLHNKKESNLYAAYAIKGEGINLPGEGGWNAGHMAYTSMESKNLQEAGMKDTRNGKFVIYLEDGNGKPLAPKDSTGKPRILYDRNGDLITRLIVELRAGDKNDYFGTSRHLLPGKFEELQELAIKQMTGNQNKTYTLTAEDFKKDVTISK